MHWWPSGNLQGLCSAASLQGAGKLQQREAKWTKKSALEGAGNVMKFQCLFKSRLGCIYTNRNTSYILYMFVFAYFWDIFQCIYIYIYIHTVTSPISSTWNKWKSWWVSPVFHHPAATIGLGMWWFGSMEDLSTTLSGPLVGWFLKIDTVFKKKRDLLFYSFYSLLLEDFEIPLWL